MNCESCGKRIEAKGTGRPRRTCSDRCRAALSRKGRGKPIRAGRRTRAGKVRVTKPAPLKIKIELAHEARKKWSRGSDGRWVFFEIPSRWATVPTERAAATERALAAIDIAHGWNPPKPDLAVDGITVEMVEAAGFVEDERASFGTWPTSDREERPNYRIVGNRRVYAPAIWDNGRRLGSSLPSRRLFRTASEEAHILRIRRDHEDMTVSANFLRPQRIQALEVGWLAALAAVETPREKRIQDIMRRTGWPRRKVVVTMDKVLEAEAFPVTDDPVIREVAWELGLDGWAAMLAVRSEKEVTPVPVTVAA